MNFDLRKAGAEMKEIMGKICRNRVLWSVVGILLVLYFFIGMHGISLVQRLGVYFDGMTPAFLGAVVLLMLYISGMVKNFLNGFRIAFSRKETFLGILSSYAMYPALFLLILTPVKARLTAASGEKG